MKDKSQELASALFILVHHADEVNAANKALKQKQKDMQYHVDSFKRFFPFKGGDLLMEGKDMIYLVGLKRIEFKSTGRTYDNPKSEVVFVIEYKRYEDRYKDYSSTKDILLTEIGKWTSFRNSPKELTELLSD